MIQMKTSKYPGCISQLIIILKIMTALWSFFLITSSNVNSFFPISLFSFHNISHTSTYLLFHCILFPFTISNNMFGSNRLEVVSLPDSVWIHILLGK